MTLLEAVKRAREDICGAKLCEINSMSSRVEMIRLMDSAVAVLSQAIAEAEAKDRALKLALQHGSFEQGSGVVREIRQALGQTDEKGNPMTYWGGLKEAEKQEPVGQLQEEAYGRGQVMWFKKPADKAMLYTHPHEWQGLTDDQWEAIKIKHYARTQDLKEAIEAQLKENNT